LFALPLASNDNVLSRTIFWIGYVQGRSAAPFGIWACSFSNESTVANTKWQFREISKLMYCTNKTETYIEVLEAVLDFL